MRVMHLDCPSVSSNPGFRSSILLSMVQCKPDLRLIVQDLQK
jgi:hypothetical protein